MTPVLLTAMAATLGLVPLAVGFNIDFVTLFTELRTAHFLRWRQCSLLGSIILDHDFWIDFRNVPDTFPCPCDVPAFSQTKSTD